MPLAARVLAPLLLLLAAAGCGDDDDTVSEDRATQVRSAALEAGLPEDVADVLALAARGPTATFQVTYAGTEGARLVVSQDPPDRRVDVIAGGQVVESRVLRGGTAYRCDMEGEPPELRCARAAGSLDAPGAFTAEALAEFTEQLGDSVGAFDLTVERRAVADVEATCLVTTPKAGTPLDGTGPGAETLCVSEEGAQLLVDAAGERLVAESYTTAVSDGTFDVPG